MASRKRNPDCVDQFDGLSIDAPPQEEQVQNTAAVVDRISDLPDDLLRRIIHLLPHEFAAHTRLLSTRWLDICNITTVEDEHAIINSFILTLLGFAFSPLNNTFNYPWKHVFHSRDSPLVFVATMGLNRNLHLDFSSGEHHHHLDSLPQATLNAIPIGRRFETLSLIRSFRLTSIDHLSANIALSLLLCPLFHSLVSVEIFNSESLTQLTLLLYKMLRHVSILDSKLLTISIGADNLRSFRYRGKCPFMCIRTDNGLEDVMLDFREGSCLIYDPYDYWSWPSLETFQTAVFLTMCQWTFEIMIRRRTCNLIPPFIFEHLKELWWIDSSMEDNKIDSLITYLEACPSLEKLFVTIDPTCYSLPSEGIDINHTSRADPLRHLKMVKMDGFEHEKDAVLLACHIFNITEVEPTVLVTLRDSCTRRLLKVHPNRRLFVEETDSAMLNTKHVHMSV